MKKVLLTVLFLLCSTASHGTIFYASPSGSGGCSTDRNSPSSFGTGIGCIGPGHTLRLRSGTYNIGPWGGPASGNSNSSRTIVEGDPGDGNRPAQLNVGPSFHGNGISFADKSWITLKNLKILGNDVDAATIKSDSGSQGLRIENCEVSHLPRTGFAQQGIHPHGGNHEIIGNTIHDNGLLDLEHGIYCNCADTLIEGNEIYNHKGFGVHNYAEGTGHENDNTIVRNNIIHNNDYGMVLNSGDNQQAYNNLLYTNPLRGIQTYNGGNVFVANNTIVGGGEAMVCGMSGVYVNNISVGNSPNTISCDGTSSPNLTSGSPTDIFVNPGANNYKLKSGSPAIDAGTSSFNVSSRVTTDIEGVTRPIDGNGTGGAQWDMGAYEFGTGPPIQQGTFYVDPTGNDNPPGNGTAEAPWATIQKCATSAGADNTCRIRTGTYRETITPAANGMTFMPDTGATVTVSGADVVGGWTVHSGNIYKASSMTWTMGVGSDQVFVDGQMMNLARHPNATLDVSHPTWNTTDTVSPTDEGNGDTNPWSFTDSALTQASGFWVGAEITTLAPWLWSQSGLVTASNGSNVTYTNLHPSQQRLDATQPGSNYRYYLSNVLGALDFPGEWFWGSNVLYLWTPNGDSPSGHVVEAKHRQYAFDLSGRANTKITNIKIFSASINMNSTTTGTVIDGLDAKYVWHSTRNVPDPAIGQNDSKWGGWKRGIKMDGNNNIIKNCNIQYSSHNGVYMHGTNQTIDNCTIRDINYIKTEGGGVDWMGQDPGGSSPGCSGLKVLNSTITNSGRHGVNSYYCDNIEISHNDMSHWGIDTGDNGCWYTSKGGTHGIISYNHCHDTEAVGYRFGIYMDATPQNYTVHHNVVWNVAYGINVGEPSTNVSVYNNTVWFVADGFSIITLHPDSSNVRVYNNLAKNGIDTGTDPQNNLETSSPGFVDVNAFNFQLAAGSPAINQGRVITGITDGFVGTNPDIGAYEFGVPAWRVGATGPPSGCPCGTPSCPPCPTGGPIATWTFDQGTGTTAGDSVDNNHATLSGGAAWGPPKVGAFSIVLDGVSAYLSLPSSVITDFSSDHTVCMWAKTTNPAALGTGDFKQTFLNLSPDGSSGLRWVLIEAPLPGGKWNVTHSLNSTPTWLTTSSQVFTANTWVYLCHTYVGSSNTLALYVNGLPATATPPANDFYFPANANVLGARSGSDGMVSGGIDKTDIWNRALSSAEIAALVTTTRKSVMHRRIPAK